MHVVAQAQRGGVGAGALGRRPGAAPTGAGALERPHPPLHPRACRPAAPAPAQPHGTDRQRHDAGHAGGHLQRRHQPRGHRGQLARQVATQPGGGPRPAAAVAGERHGGGGIERHPAHPRDVHLGPGVGVVGVHLVQTGERVPGARRIAHREAGRHPGRPQQHHERGADLLAEPDPGVEQEVVDRVGPGPQRRDVERVAGVRRHPGLDGPYLVVRRGGAGGELDRQLAHAVGQRRRQLQVARHLRGEQARRRGVRERRQPGRREVGPVADHRVARAGIQQHARAHGAVGQHVDGRVAEVELRGRRRPEDDVRARPHHVVRLHEALAVVHVERAEAGQLDGERTGLRQRLAERAGPRTAVVAVERLAPPEVGRRGADTHHERVVGPPAHARVERVGEAEVAERRASAPARTRRGVAPHPGGVVAQRGVHERARRRHAGRRGQPHRERERPHAAGGRQERERHRGQGQDDGQHADPTEHRPPP